MSLTKQRLRVIDGLIAEHLFGWKWFSAMGVSYLIPPWGQEEATNFSVHWTPGLKWRRITEDKLRTAKKSYDIEHHYSDYARWALPHYTTKLEDAFFVVTHCGQTEEVAYYLRSDEPYKGEWFVFNLNDCNINALNESLPIAFCLFALRLKKVELLWK